VKKQLIVLIALAAVVFLPPLSDARLAPRKAVLQNGLTVVTSEQKALPMVTLSLLIEAGSRFEPEGREGLANIAARLLTYGTKSSTALQISETLDFLGATLSTACGEEAASVSMTLLKKDLDAGLQLLAEILSASTFPVEEIERQKQSTIASIRAREEDPGQVAQLKFIETLFPKSPYGRPVEGTAESVKRVDRPGLLEFYQIYYRPNHAILTVVGDVSHQEAIDRLGKTFRPWEKGGAAVAPAPPPAPGAATVVKINKDLTQANIILGHEGVPRAHPDYYAIQVMNYILGGGGFSSRLMESIRNQRGLAYSVYSAFEPEKYAGSFQVSMQTKNESAGEAIRVAVEEMRKIREQGATEEELKAAKDYLIGSFPLRLDTNRKVAAFLSQVEFFGLGLDYPERYPDIVRAVTRQDVLRVAKRYLQPERLIFVVVADQAKAGLKAPLDTGKGL
jgi:zinc protease